MLSGGQILATSFEAGSAGTLIINANNNVVISGEDAGYNARFNALFDSFFQSSLGNGQTIPEAAINAQESALDIIDPVVPTSSLQATNFPDFFPDTFVLNPSGPGSAGNILVASPNILMSDQSAMEVSTFGINDGGNIFLFTQNLDLSGGAEIIAATFGNGNGGDIIIEPLDDGSPSIISIDGRAPFLGIDPETNAPNGGFPSGIFASTELRPTLISGVDPVITFGRGGDIQVNADTITVNNAGVINARTRSAGEGGDVVINVRDLNLLGGGQILAPTFRSGDAGDIEITASGNILIDGFDPNSAALFDAIQNALIIDAGFTAQEAFDLTRFTIGTVGAKSSLVSDVQPEAVANGGDIDILDAQSLTLSNFGLIGVSTNGVGNAGNLFANVQDAISLSNGGNIRALVEGGAFGNGGDIELSARSLSLTNGAQISASIFREEGDTSGGIAQRAGDIRVNVADSVTLAGFGLDFIGEGPFRSGFLVSTEEGAQGDAGSLQLRANNLSILEGGVIIANTENSSDAGNIILDIGDRLLLERGGLISVDGSFIGTNPGNPGNININAAAVEFVEGGKIRAVTSSGNNANINLTVQSYINMRGTQTSTDPSGSCETCNEISTEAFGFNAQGGNITIRVGNGVFAQLGENSDIVANAVGSNLAANITIEPLEDGRGYVGAFTFADPKIRGRTLQSDLDASSQLTVDNGNEVISEGQQTQAEVPSIPLDSTNLIDRRCELQATGNRSEFSVIGRGGLPTDPGDRLEESPLIDDLGPETMPAGEPQGAESGMNAVAASPPNIIRETQGWVQEPDGSIYLYGGVTGEEEVPNFGHLTCESNQS